VKWRVRKLVLGGWLVHRPHPNAPADPWRAERIAELDNEGQARRLAALLNGPRQAQVGQSKAEGE
jgi:hypothetical protein